MQLINQILCSVLALGAGGVIGLVFGAIQDAAARKNQALQTEGKLTNGWAVMPGSMRRTAYLLMALALVQVVFPLVFNNGYQWWVSGGVVLGYGAMLYRKLRQTMQQVRAN
ncbi:MAG TPA: hypothetical protein VHB20_15140 [Verrucomicrobiae bacterium]|jgi:hypothetical protein|nr:hypothetical protein [Verrucomicrobiae bacterium]